MPVQDEKTSGFPRPAGIGYTVEKGQIMARVTADVSPSDRLRLAAGKGDVRSVSDLLDQGISSDKDKDGRTLLHIAAQNGHVDVMRTLVARGFETSAKDMHGYTPMHRGSAQGHLDVIEFLVKNGCPVDEEDECGNTALHAAAWNGYSQTIDLLLRNKARVNVVNKAGFTALHSAAQKGHNQSARVLLFAGCQPNIKNKYGETALHTSARYGHAGVARILISAKCKVNVQNKNGETALHVSVTCKRQKIAKLLVEAGIKKKLKNKQGETAMEISRKMNDLEMILILTSEEKATVIRRHRSEDIRLSSPVEDTISDTKSDSSRKRRDSHSRQETDKENYQTIGSCSAGPAAASAKSTKSSCAAVPSNAMSASNRLLFDSLGRPEKLLDGFKQHQLEKQMKQLPDGVAPKNKHGKKEKMVKGLLSEYAPKPGQMYYRDLSGKLKQGPVGYTSVYEGGPALQELERENNADHDGHYEPITSSKDLQKAEKCCHQRLSNQPTTEQGHGVRGRNSCTTLSRVQKSTMTVEGRRSRVQSEPRLGNRSRRSADIEHDLKHQPVQEGPCDCCCSNAVIEIVERNGASPDVDAYGFIQSRYPHGVSGHAAENFSPQGRLFKSRSDETLSTHSGRRRHHPSMRHQKKKAQNIDTSGDRYWTMSKTQGRAREVNRDKTYEKLRSHPRASFQARTDPRPYTYHEESNYVLPSALLSDRKEHTSRGFVARDYMQQNQPLSSNPASTPRVQVGEAYQNCSEVFHGSEERLNSSEIVFGSRLIYNDIPSASKPGLPLSQSSPFVVEEQLSATAEVLQSCPCANPLPDGPSHPNTPATSPVCDAACQHDNCCSLQSASNHPKADSGSNPDSGYGSKIYRTRGNQVMVFRPQDSNSSGKESRQSKEEDKISFSSSHWNTSECTVTPRIPNPDVVTRPTESRQMQPSRKTTAQRQQSFREITGPSRLPSANHESLKPVSPPNLHHVSSKSKVVTRRCPSDRPTSWCSHQEPQRCRMENTFSSNQTHYHQPAEVYEALFHRGTNRDIITESTTHPSNNLPRPAKPSKHRDRPTSYQQYEPIATRQNHRSSDKPVLQNDRIRICDQSNNSTYDQQHSERDASNVRQGNRPETPQNHDFHVAQADGLNAREYGEFHRTESFQKQVHSPVEPSNILHVQPKALKYPLNRGGQMQSVLEIGRSTMV